MSHTLRTILSYWPMILACIRQCRKFRPLRIGRPTEVTNDQVLDFRSHVELPVVLNLHTESTTSGNPTSPLDKFRASGFATATPDKRAKGKATVLLR